MTYCRGTTAICLQHAGTARWLTRVKGQDQFAETLSPTQQLSSDYDPPNHRSLERLPKLLTPETNQPPKMKGITQWAPQMTLLGMIYVAKDGSLYHETEPTDGR